LWLDLQVHDFSRIEVHKEHWRNRRLDVFWRLRRDFVNFLQSIVSLYGNGVAGDIKTESALKYTSTLSRCSNSVGRDEEPCNARFI
jgi:hypothetical protein